MNIYFDYIVSLAHNERSSSSCRVSSRRFFFYLQHFPLQIIILHAWKDHRTRFTLYTFPSYFVLIPMAVCVLFGFLDL